MPLPFKIGRFSKTSKPSQANPTEDSTPFPPLKFDMNFSRHQNFSYSFDGTTHQFISFGLNIDNPTSFQQSDPKVVKIDSLGNCRLDELNVKGHWDDLEYRDKLDFQGGHILLPSEKEQKQIEKVGLAAVEKEITEALRTPNLIYQFPEPPVEKTKKFDENKAQHDSLKFTSRQTVFELYLRRKRGYRYLQLQEAKELLCLVDRVGSEDSKGKGVVSNDALSLAERWSVDLEGIPELKHTAEIFTLALLLFLVDTDYSKERSDGKSPKISKRMESFLKLHMNIWEDAIEKIRQLVSEAEAGSESTEDRERDRVLEVYNRFHEFCRQILDSQK